MTQMDRYSVSTDKLLSVVVDGDHYYGGSSAAIPFKWESQPGTPRRLFNSQVSAPLTPPPSYFYTSSPSTKPVNPKKPNIHFGSFHPKNRSAPSSPAASSSSSSSSSTSSPVRTPNVYGRNSRRSMWFGSVFTLGYGSKQYNAKSSGCYGSIVNALLRDVK